MQTRRGILEGASRRGGFTLWELLVVVAIIAISFSLIQLAPSLGDENRELKRVGKDLGKMFRLLNQEAVFENRNYAISVRDHGFVVLEYKDGAWAETEDSFFRRIKLTETQRSKLVIEDLVVDTSDKKKNEPHILILSSGEMTPFEWHIDDTVTHSGILLEGNLLGSVLMTGPEPIS
ncbi:MAG: GspH/FimT family pseudopilin [Gammaproteobacteria bacterium]|jgi:prepilin-type N-terminal cleavage/methylation domain-containing protein